MKKVIILGAGGHAKVLADLIHLLPDVELKGFLDDQLQTGSPVSGPFAVIGKTSEAAGFVSEEHWFVSGIGNNEVRKKMAFANQEANWATLIHPAAVIAPSARIGAGSVVLAGAIVASNTTVGNHCIVNSGVVIDHDCSVLDFVHLKTGSVIGSNSRIDTMISTEIGSKTAAFTHLRDE